MKPEELHALIEEYRDGTISAADARRLADAIRSDPGTAARARKALEYAGFAARALEGDDDASFARSFAERVRAERGGAEFMSAFEKRIRPTARTRRLETASTSPIPFLVAAGILLALLGLLMSRGNRPPPAVVADRHQEQPEPEPRPEPVPKTAPAPMPAPESPKPAAPPTVDAPEPLPVRPEQPKADPPVPPVEPPKPEPTRVVRVGVLARLEKIEGDVQVDGRRAVAGQELETEQTLQTGPTKSRASVVLADGSRLGLEADGVVKEISKGSKGTRVTLSQGTLSADVAKQPADQPLTIATPHGEARVLGTVLRLVVDPASTRLEVREGKVRLTRDGKSVDVPAGQFATAGAGTPLAAKSLSPDEIVLVAQQAKLTGAEWTLIRDLKSLTGVALEAGQSPFKVVDHVETRPSYATFTFFAPADREYRIWLRATSLEKGDPWTRDLVTIEPTRCVLSQKSPFFGAAPTTAYVFTGVAATPGYTWLSGHGEETKAEAPPLTVKFNEPGWQNIRVYVGNPWVRIDTIWLSTTQKTRPPARQAPPSPTEK
ncbi:MAG TPA: FecR family protein [Planctomycetota bacterium]|nr:FecR family protein [Planctomycetota bacterium]